MIKWNVHLQRLQGHSSHIAAVAFSSDGQLLASASDDHAVRLWDTATGTNLKTFEGLEDCVGILGFSPNSQFMALGLCNTTVQIWNVANGTHMQTLKGHVSVFY